MDVNGFQHIFPKFPEYSRKTDKEFKNCETCVHGNLIQIKSLIKQEVLGRSNLLFSLDTKRRHKESNVIS